MGQHLSRPAFPGNVVPYSISNIFFLIDIIAARNYRKKDEDDDDDDEPRSYSSRPVSTVKPKIVSSTAPKLTATEPMDMASVMGFGGFGKLI